MSFATNPGIAFLPGQAQPLEFVGGTPEESRTIGSYVYFPDSNEWFTWVLRLDTKKENWLKVLPDQVPEAHRTWVLLL